MNATAMKIGSVPSTDIAEILAQKFDCPPKKCVICTVYVVASLRVRTSANRKSFQANTKVKIAVANRPARHIGNTTFQITCQRVQPSTRADSSSALGMSSM